MYERRTARCLCHIVTHHQLFLLFTYLRDSKMHKTFPFGDKSCKGLAFFVKGYCMVPFNCMKYGFFVCGGI